MKKNIKYLKNLNFKLFIVLVILFSQYVLSQESNHTHAVIDLTKATAQHKVYVEVQAPKISEGSVEYHFPKMVPGTYAIYNFGRFISEFTAMDASGNKLEVEKLDTNRWLINNAASLSKVGYWVEDTYHSNSKPIVFEPVGSCIEPGKVFVLNNFCFVGYFSGYKDLPFTLSITKPQGFYGSTSLPVIDIGESVDNYRAKNYFELHDNPILYCKPDTASVMVNNAMVLISIYSPNNTVSSSFLRSHTEQLFEAQGKYLGGTLPTDRYSILVYMYEGSSKSGSAGALEHFTSTTMTYPEIPQEQFVEPFIDVISHEFFHTVTPLGIHSREIQDFDFINPKMSKHLWLYEGSTEYYAHHAQVKFGVTTLRTFIEKTRQKIYIASLYFNDTLPFTELSLGALDKYKTQYINVYNKGALISMCLDLYLLKLSGGKYGLQNLKQELGVKYGPDVPFEDDELFDVITSMTYPEVREFFRKYVEGPQKLPYNEFLSYAGYNFFEKHEVEELGMIGASLRGTPGGQLEVEEVRKFGKMLGLKEGDILFSFNGTEIKLDNLSKITEDFEKNAKAGDDVTVTVIRLDEKGREQKKILSTKTQMVKETEMFAIVPVKDPTAQQLEIRKAWINQ
jgi:predicted metalloprotease with PDZ domain